MGRQNRVASCITGALGRVLQAMCQSLEAMVRPFFVHARPMGLFKMHMPCAVVHVFYILNFERTNTLRACRSCNPCPRLARAGSPEAALIAHAMLHCAFPAFQAPSIRMIGSDTQHLNLTLTTK